MAKSKRKLAFTVSLRHHQTGNRRLVQEVNPRDMMKEKPGLFVVEVGTARQRVSCP